MGLQAACQVATTLAVSQLPSLPSAFAESVERIVTTARAVEGYLTEREMRFLALLAACPTAPGDILEIGSYKGKSAVILAQAAQLAAGPLPRLACVDPMTSPSD